MEISSIIENQIHIKETLPPKTKVTVNGDSIIKYLRRDNLSSKSNDVKVDAHPGSTTLDMLDYIKPIVQRKHDVLVIHTGTNDLTNGVNPMKEVSQVISFYFLIMVILINRV